MNRAGVGEYHARFLRPGGRPVSVFFLCLTGVSSERFRDIVSVDNNLSLMEAGYGE